MNKDILNEALDLTRMIKPEKVEEFTEVIWNTILKGKTIFIFGNGGSASNSSHIAEDWAKCTVLSPDQKIRAKVISLADNTSYITALANDEGYDRIFVGQLENLAQSGDIALGISGSGNSPNVLNTMEYARQNGLIRLAFTGFDGGKLKNLVNYEFNVPSFKIGLVESIHIIFAHLITLELIKRFELQLKF